MTNETALFCPKCLKPTIDVSGLIGGKASCRSCSWEGTREECLSHGFKHQFASSEEMLQIFNKDIQKFVAEFGAVPLARMLRKWGFIKDPIDTVVLTRYVKAIARGIATELLKTREAIEVLESIEPQAKA